LLNSDAQRVINKYMDQNQQADLFIKAQTLANLQTQGALTEKQIQTEIQRAILTAAEASGKKIDNRVASDTADSLIKAANASRELQYRDSTYDYKNVKLRKHTEYNTSMANQRAAEYGAELARKQGRTHYWDSASRGLGAVASGAGNVIGAGIHFGNFGRK
jgi:transglutaminase/protease-like cytokinesis protein 3